MPISCGFLSSDLSEPGSVRKTFVRVPPSVAAQALRCQPRLIGGPGVAGDLVEAQVPRDRGDLVDTASGLGEAAAGRLAQSVRGPSRQTDGAAAFAEPSRQPRGRE